MMFDEDQFTLMLRSGEIHCRVQDSLYWPHKKM